MKTTQKASRLLGLAFLLQFITSFTSGVILRPLWFTEGDMAQTLRQIAGNPIWLRVCILLDMLTALGVIFLGALLFLALRKQNEKLALTALGFYILEGALLAASRMATFSLLGLSQEFATGQSAEALRLARLACDSMEFVGGTLHIMAFVAGAILFYALLDQAWLVPRPLSLWGLITVLPFALGAPLMVLGIEFPFILYVPYVPFELGVGLWILVKGIRE
ncbi:MAG: DUF4386 domain-containing protein [Chloroflexota bacterium]